MDQHYDAIVIGAGIIGACIAFELAKSGKSTLVVDKNPAAGYGSTGNSCAIIRTHYSTLEGAALAFENYPYWQDWPGYLNVIDEAGMAEFRGVGCVYTCIEPNNYGQKLIDIADELGIPYEIWTPDVVRQRMPLMNPETFHPAKRADDPRFGEASGEMRRMLYFPKAGYINDPQLASHNVQRAAETSGAEFAFNRRVTDVLKADGRCAGVELDGEQRVEAPVVVNAAGPHSYKVNEMAGVTKDMNIATKALRVEVAHVPSPDGYDFENRGIIGSDNDIGGYYRPETGNHILIGSEEPDCDSLEWVDPDTFDRNLTEQARVQALRAAQRFPTMRIPNRVKGIVDLYDVSDDWIPIYDRSDLAGFYLAIGTSGNQFKNGPVVGKLMAALIDAVQGGRDHDADPLQFELPHVGRTLDLRFCSRRREINRESSFSVVG